MRYRRDSCKLRRRARDNYGKTKITGDMQIPIERGRGLESAFRQIGRQIDRPQTDQ